MGWLGGLGADWLADEDDVDAAGQLLVSARPGVDLARMSHAKASRRSGDKRNIRTWWPYTGPGEVPTTAASSAREVMPSLGKIRYRWLRTVRCDR